MYLLNDIIVVVTELNYCNVTVIEETGLPFQHGKCDAIMFSTLSINSFPHPDGARVPEEITMVSNITLSPYQFKTLTPLRLKYMGAIANLDIAASQKTSS